MDIPENSINEILENNPSQGTLYVILSTMKENGKHDLVIRECLKALSRFPEDLTLRKLLAEAYLGAGRLLESEAEFDRVIKGIKALAGVYRSQAEMYVRQQKEGEAIESLKQYLTFFPEDEEAGLLLEELQPAEDTPQVELQDEPVEILGIQEEPELPEIEAPPQQQDFPELETLLEMEADLQLENIPELEGITIQEEFPESEEVPGQEDFPGIMTTSLAETYFNQGKLNEAREIYEKLAEKDPENPALKSRLDEISAILEPEDESEELKAEESIRQKKEKMISILDSWRSNIRESGSKEMSAG